MTEIKSRIKYAMDYREMKQQDLADKTGIPKASISQYISGFAKPKTDRLFLMANALNVNEAWLLGYNVPMERITSENKTIDYQIPMYSSISCGTGLFVDDLVEDYITVPNRMINPNCDYFAHAASGDSMIGKGIKDGDILVFEKTNYLENGQIGSFCIGESQAVCKIFRKLSNGMIMLESANDKYEPILVDIYDECFRIIGKYKFKFSIEQ